MSSSATKAGFGALLVILVAVGFYRWSPQPADVEVDQAIAKESKSYVCPHCGHVFDLSIAQVTDMRRKHGDIVCLACGKLGAKERDAPVAADETPTASGDSDGDGDEAEGVEKVNRRHRAMGGMRKKPRQGTQP